MITFEMDKMYMITGRELLALLSLTSDGVEEAEAIMENVAGRAVEEDRTFQHPVNDPIYKKGILELPEVTDADKEAIRKAMEANDKAIPIIQVHPMKETFRDIATILAWLYSKGVLWHGRDEQIEKLLRNVVKEGEE